MSQYRITESPLETGAVSTYPYSKVYFDRLIGESKFGDPVELATRRGDLMDVPRGLCPVGLKDSRAAGESAHFDSSFVSRGAEQTMAVNTVVKYLKEGKSLVLQAPTGFGKTMVALDIIAQIGVKTMVVLHKTDLMTGWAEKIDQVLGLPDIGLVRGTKKNLGPGIVLGMVQTLIRPDKLTDEEKGRFGLIIFDEVHRMGATEFSRCVAMFPALLRLGLSATPERIDGKEFVFEAHLGARSLRINAAVEHLKIIRFDSGWECRGWLRRADLGRVGHVINDLVKSTRRNDKIVRVILAAHAKGRHVVVFSDRIEHLKTLRDRAVYQGLSPDDVGMYVGSKAKSKSMILSLAIAKRVVFATYAMMSEGTDRPSLDTCVMATPRANVAQPIGRILREHPGKKSPVVFDPVDDSSPVFGIYGRKRRKWYAEVGAEVVHVNL